MKSLLLQWHITERCNLRCTHCYQGDSVAAELPLSALLGILDQFTGLLDALGCERGQITVTGGEPFLRADFFELLAAFARLKPRLGFAILTNGSLVDAARLAPFGPRFVQVSVEGTAATHDRIRGSGSHARTVQAIRDLRAAGIRTHISFTAHRGNYREFGDVARLGARLGVTRVWADRLIPEGRGSGCETLTAPETQEFLGIMRSARDREQRRWFGPRTEIAMHRALQFLAGGGEPYRCTAGDTLITIMPNGDLFPCRRMPVRVGNVLERPLVALYREALLFAQLRTHTTAGCEACRHRDGCRGGLRCLAYAMTGDPFRADPGCILATPAHCYDRSGVADELNRVS